MAYPVLNAYLNERNPLNHGSSGFWYALLGIIGGAALSMAGLLAWLPVWIALVVFMGWRTHLHKRSSERKRRLIYRLDQQRWLDELTRFAYMNQLANRITGGFGECLENCAEIRESISLEVREGDWTRLCKQPEWELVRTDVIGAADHMLVQALWLARPFIRKRGEWKSVHRERALSASAEEALGRIAEVESKLQALLDEVAGEPFSSIGRPDPVETVLAELSALRRAADEVLELGK